MVKKPSQISLALTGLKAIPVSAAHQEKSPQQIEPLYSDCANSYMTAAQSTATIRAYASDLRHFIANGGTVPATANQVVEYLAQFAGKLSASTLERRLIAIDQAHVVIAAPSPAADLRVKRTMQGIRRTFGTKQRQVRPMVKDDLLETLMMIDRQNKRPVKAARDRALLLVGFAGAFRRSELVAIQVGHVKQITNGMEIFLPHSKTDQERVGRTVFIPHADGDRCPVRALMVWLKLAGIEEGFVFRAVTRHDRVARTRLSAQSVALVVKALVNRTGANSELVSGHSLRSGYCTTAAMAGMPSWQIKLTTGHKSDVTLLKYIRPVNRRKIPTLL
ncbi:MAG: site-specific integrase [Glaciimonas sp.]|nr:site-specific integrase [Glaciimonas sp.]